MTSNGRQLLALGLVAAAWVLYTRSRGLTVTGQLAAGGGAPILLGGLLHTPFGLAGAGNANGSPAESVTSIGSAPPGSPASKGGVPSVGDVMPDPDYSLYEASPYWSWDLGWEQPVNTGVPSLDWQ